MFKLKLNKNKVEDLHGKWIDDGSGNLYLLDYIGNNFFVVYTRDYDVYNDNLHYDELREGFNKAVLPYKILDCTPEEYDKRKSEGAE